MKKFIIAIIFSLKLSKEKFFQLGLFFLILVFFIDDIDDCKWIWQQLPFYVSENLDKAKEISIKGTIEFFFFQNEYFVPCSSKNKFGQCQPVLYQVGLHHSGIAFIFRNPICSACNYFCNYSIFSSLD